MIVVTVFLSNMNQMKSNLARNQKENCHYDHIPLKLKGNRNLVHLCIIGGISSGCHLLVTKGFYFEIYSI